MGRYYTGDIEGKFWFGVQPTGDLLEFGSDRSESSLNVVVYYEEFKFHKKKLENLKINFKKNFKITYKDFIRKMNKKGSSETNTPEWKKMCREASLIELGDKIIKALKDKKDDLYIEGEC